MEQRWIDNALDDIRELVYCVIGDCAEKAQCEIKAMGESARRSIGQMTRRDHFWRRAGSIYHVLYLKSLAERLK